MIDAKSLQKYDVYKYKAEMFLKEIELMIKRQAILGMSCLRFGIVDKFDNKFTTRSYYRNKLQEKYGLDYITSEKNISNVCDLIFPLIEYELRSLGYLIRIDKTDTNSNGTLHELIIRW